MEQTSPPPKAPVRAPGIALGRVLGVPVHLHTSVALLALLVTVMYGELVRGLLDLSAVAGYVAGFGFVLCLLGSVLLHELGHALTARRFGIGVRGITLELLGGYTEMDRDAPSPRVDLLVSLAGPAVSFVLGLAAIGVTVALPSQGLAYQFAFQLAVSNVLVAVFNSLPGLPLDGGRALRAGVWAITRDRHLGTEVAGKVGRGLAVGTAGLVVWLVLIDWLRPVALPLVLLVAFTLWRGAGQAVQSARLGRRFPLIDLAALARPVFTVAGGTPLAEAQRRAAEAGRGDDVIGVADSAGRLIALVDRTAAEAVPEQRRPWLAVDSVARDVGKLPAIPLGADGEHVIETVRAHPGAQYAVTSGENIVGVLHITDLVQFLEPRRKMTK